ncbi:MAG: acetyl ornithine aminotransferase family protein [Anaerolineales bacterium]|jgi:4-aminobutyrate aminotransferase
MQSMNLPGPKAKAIIQRDREVISQSYPRSSPFVMDRGKGTEVWDVDGNRYLDFAAGIAVVSTGHSNPMVVKAIQEQAERFLHISSDFYHESWVQLGERLNEIAPFSEPAVSFMTNSGTESVEAAIKLARHSTGRSQFIGFLGAFHGRTMGSVTFTASKPVYHRGFYPLMNGVVHAPFPNLYRKVLNSHKGERYGETVVRYIEEQILGHLVPSDDVAAVLVEPIQGEGGYIVPPQDFFPALRELCDRYGILLIVDEVQSGMGRTGKWWAIENFGVEPDIVCSAKGIASGLPLGAMIARRSIMNWPRGAHGNTFGGNPIACVASLATIDLIEKGYIQNAVNIGAPAIQRLKEMKNQHPSIGDVRGLGLMLALEFVKDHETKHPHPKMRDRVERLGFEHGLLLLGCGKSTIRISPPLSVSSIEMDEGLRILDRVISIAEEELNIHKPAHVMMG